MKLVELRCGLQIPVVGVGLAHLHLLPTRERERLIAFALELGLTHFDTARFYGDGVSEVTLGQALKLRRKEATITTKFGLLPTPGIAAMGPFSPAARKGRSLLRKLGLLTYPRRSYSLVTLQDALHTSLKALRTDYIDVLAIHEPTGTADLSDELLEELTKVRARGMVRYIGCAGSDIADVVARWGKHIDIIQTAENSWGGEDFIPDITYSLFSSAGRALTQWEVEQRIQAALRRRPGGAILVQTRDLNRLQRFAELASCA